MPRVVEVVDRTEKDTAGASGGIARAIREKNDPMVLGSVGAPMSSEVIEVRAKPGMSLLSLNPES